MERRPRRSLPVKTQTRFFTVSYITVSCFAVSCLAALLIIMSACGSSGATGGKAPAASVFTMDVSAAGERLYKELEYRDTLEELDPAIVFTLLGINEDDVAEVKCYFSSGATAEEVIVFKATDAKALEALKTAVSERIEDQKNVYVSYAPQEVAYLKGAIVQAKGDYLIYCVPADSQAGAKLTNELFAGR